MYFCVKTEEIWFYTVSSLIIAFKRALFLIG